MAVVRCPTCHREERWSSAGVEVLLAGGARRPREAPALAAWRILRAAREGLTGPVVGACAACGLPLVATEPGPAALPSWTLATPGGELVVADAIVGPQGPLGAEAAEAWLGAQLRERLAFRPFEWLFTAMLFALLLIPLAFWLYAISLLVVFLSSFGDSRVGF